MSSSLLHVAPLRCLPVEIIEAEQANADLRLLMFLEGGAGWCAHATPFHAVDAHGRRPARPPLRFPRDVWLRCPGIQFSCKWLRWVQCDGADRTGRQHKWRDCSAGPVCAAGVPM